MRSHPWHNTLKPDPPLPSRWTLWRWPESNFAYQRGWQVATPDEAIPNQAIVVEVVPAPAVPEAPENSVPTPSTATPGRRQPSSGSSAEASAKRRDSAATPPETPSERAEGWPCHVCGDTACKRIDHQCAPMPEQAGKSEEVREASEWWTIYVCPECGARCEYNRRGDGAMFCEGPCRLPAPESVEVEVVPLALLTQVEEEHKEITEALQAESDANFARAEQAESSLEQVRLEAAQWKGSFDGMVAVEKELRARIEELEGALRRIAEGAVGGTAPIPDEHRASGRPGSCHDYIAALRGFARNALSSSPTRGDG